MKNLKRKAVEQILKEIESKVNEIKKIYEEEGESLVSTHWNLHYSHIMSYNQYIELKTKIQDPAINT